jgi:hypothetical protein
MNEALIETYRLGSDLDCFGANQAPIETYRLGVGLGVFADVLT